MPPLYRHKKNNGPAPVLWVDVDDTLLDFTGAHPAGLRGLERWAAGHMETARATRFTAIFERCFKACMHGWHPRSETGSPGSNGGSAPLGNGDAVLAGRLAKRLERMQGDGPRPVRWAREVWLEIASEDSAAMLTREQMVEAAGAYWRELAPAQRLFPGVVETLRELRTRGYRVWLLTSSDCRQMPDPNGWHYDEQAAVEWKQRRLSQVLRPVMSEVNGLVLGDPYEKSGPEFFRHAAAGLPIEPEATVVAVGDSLESDIRFARQADPRVRFGVLCDPHGRYRGGDLSGADVRVDHLPGLLEFFF